MKKYCFTLIVSGVFTCSFVANADLVSVTCSNENTSAITFNYGAGWTWNYGGTTNYEQVSMIATQAAPGGMFGSIVTSSTNDPSLGFLTYIQNGSGLDWTNYQVLVLLSQPFTITNPIVYTPSDWTIAYSANSSFNADIGENEGFIEFSAGTPVSGDPESPGTLEYGYTLLFSGATGYTFTQDLSPNAVPEPGTAGLLAMGGILYGLINRRMRR